MKTQTKPKRIAQATLAELYTIRSQRIALDRQARDLEKHEKAIVSDCLARIEAGASIAPGKYIAEVKDGGRYPSWRSLFERYVSKAKAEELLQQTEPTKKLVVKERE